jgi:hypothetical protein
VKLTQRKPTICNLWNFIVKNQLLELEKNIVAHISKTIKNPKWAIQENDTKLSFILIAQNNLRQLKLIRYDQ